MEAKELKGDLYYSENAMVLALNRFLLLPFSLLVNTSDWKNGILVFFVPLWIKKWLTVYITWGFGGGIILTFLQLLCTCGNIRSMQEFAKWNFVYEP